MLWIRATALALVAAVAILGWAGRAEAADQITGGCTVAPTSVNFPEYQLAARAQQSATGTINVTCTGTGNNTVTVGLSPGGGGTCSARAMASGTASISYNLYTSSAYQTMWCEPTRVPVSFSFNSQTLPQTQTKPLTIYGRVPAAQNVTVGSYTDSIITAVFWTGGNSNLTSFNVNIDVVPSCTMVITDIAFGTFTGVAKDGQGAVDVTCTGGVAYTIGLGGGANLSGGTRRMARTGGGFLPYLLYQDAARTAAWGDGGALGSTIGATSNGSVRKHPVYGRVQASTGPTPGTYSDTVVVTLSY